MWSVISKCVNGCTGYPKAHEITLLGGLVVESFEGGENRDDDSHGEDCEKLENIQRHEARPNKLQREQRSVRAKIEARHVS